MATTQLLADLSAASAIADADIYYVESGGVSKKITGATLKTKILEHVVAQMASSDLAYDNSVSGLSAANVKAALDEIVTRLVALESA
ncbi:MAG: hypothetical protein HXY25_06915 [Alphaproteobacteria bacterium]|nr:hypothetical protein [Alphaproteobacteria bacterium]